MKKMICLLLCLLTAVSLWGCGSNSEDSTTGSTTAGAPSPSNAVPEATDPSGGLQLPMIAISMPLIAQKATAADGTIVFTTLYQDVALTIPDTENADAMILDLLNRIEKHKGDTGALAEQAKNVYDGSGDWVAFFSNVTFNPARVDEKVISLYGKAGIFLGGMHPDSLCVSANYDLATGKALSLSDILVDAAANTALCEAVNDKLTQMKDEYYIYEGFEDVVAAVYGGVFNEGADPVEDFFLSSTGLTVFFSPYDIAPYASGSILVTIPYAELEGILKADFFPASLPENPSGTVYAALAQDVELDDFTQFAEAILTDGGDRVILYSDKLVSNVTIEVGTWSSDGIYYTPTATVFYATSLSDGDAIMLETNFSSTMPALRLSYNSNDEIHRFFITQSGEDGSIILLDDLT